MNTTAATRSQEDSEEPSSETGPDEERSSDAYPSDVQEPCVDSLPKQQVSMQPQAGTSAEPTPLETATLPQVLKIAGAVVAPATLLTALLFYFGLLWTTGFFRYLGVNYTVLDFTVQEYLIRSADGLFVPLAVITAVALLALWVHRLLLGALPAKTRSTVLRALTPVAAITGLVLASVAMAAMTGHAGVFAARPEAGGLSLSIGVLLLAYAVRLLRLHTAERRPEQAHWQASGAVVVVEWGAVFILVSVGLFWAVASYAIAVGTGRGQQIEARLSSSPDVVLYSEKSLSLQAPSVREVVCQNPEAAYRFRYDGLKLVLQSGNQYLFLPSGWTPTNGAALLIPRSEALRLEFSSAGQARSATC